MIVIDETTSDNHHEDVPVKNQHIEGPFGASEEVKESAIPYEGDDMTPSEMERLNLGELTYDLHAQIRGFVCGIEQMKEDNESIRHQIELRKAHKEKV